MNGLAEQFGRLADVADYALLSAGDSHAAVGQVQDHLATLSPEEHRQVARAVVSRKHAYSTGRYLAKRALGELGVSVSSIPTHPSRRPVWPHGVVGSITHSRRYAIAVLCLGTAIAGVGVDLELAGRVTGKIAETTMTESERAASATDWPPSPYTANFSAKEAVFKAVNPIIGLMVGFQEVEVRWLEAEWGFRAEYVGPDRQNAVLDAGRGAVFAFDGHVGALFWIPA